MKDALNLQCEPQKRAAREALAEAARLPFPRSHLAAVARSLAKVLQRHGLGQALAYMQMRVAGSKGPTPYEVIVRHLDRWLLAVTDGSGRTALAALAGRDSRYDLEATEQACLFLRALNAELEEGA